MVLSGITSTVDTPETPGGSSTGGNPTRSRTWAAAPWVVRCLRGAIWVLPLVGGYITGLLFTWVVPRPEIAVMVAVWWLGIVVVSTATVYFVRPIIHGATPLVFLYQCTLVFPDHAPSRYKIALKQRTTRELKRKVDAGQPIADTPQAAAEEIVAVLGYLNDHDRRTRGHSERVRAYSDLIATELGMNESDRLKLHWAALLHDVGKMSVRAEILNKNGKPNDEEWQELRRHPGAAAAYLRPLRPWLGSWLDAATQHHERWDGGGYPRGLSGDQISIAGRIVAVADAYDVMTSTRSYKTAWTPDNARAELARCAGSQFDPRVVRAFLSVSTRRLTSVAGPLSWLTHWPRLAEAASAIGSAGSTAAGSLATAATAVALTVTPAIAATYDGPIAIGASPQITVEAVPATTVTTTTGPATTGPATTGPTTTGPTTSEPATVATTTVTTTTGPVLELPPVVEAGPPGTAATTTTDAPGSSEAQVISVAPAEVPDSLARGRLQSGDGVFFFAEGQPRIATSSFEVLPTGPGAVTASAAGSLTIAANAQLCTYLLHADSPNDSAEFNFTIELTETIVGFSVTSNQIATTATWQLPGTAYDPDGLEVGDFLSVDGRTITGHFELVGDRDQVRIFTGC